MTAHRKKQALARRTFFVDQLEERDLPAAFNIPWPEANGLTLSFAPDGALIGSQASNLFHTLDQQLPTHDWQQTILRAFQTWAVESNVNIGVVDDEGDPFGTLGLKQGDPRFGDIRIGAFPMAADVLAVADPYDPFVANTWVGDVFLNSNLLASASPQDLQRDLYAVMLHEAGHVLGIGHSNDPQSPMYQYFQSASDSSLTSSDVASLRALFATRPPDVNDAAGGNDDLKTASPIELTTSDGQLRSTEVDADLTQQSDVDVYRVTIPQGAQSLQAQLQGVGISLLTARLTLVDGEGDVIASTESTDPLKNDLFLSFDQPRNGDVYYLKVQSARNDVFGVGAYHLLVNPGDGLSAIAEQSSEGVHLLSTTPGYVEHTYYEEEGYLSAAEAVQTYRVRSADLGPGMTNVMTVVVNSNLPAAKVRLIVLDDQGGAMDGVVLKDQDGHLEIQVPTVKSNANYIVEVQCNNLGEHTLEYEVTVDFDQDATHLIPFVNDTVASHEAVARTLQVVQSDQFHFVLSASDWNNPVETGVRMSIRDAQGRLVFTMTAADGATRGSDVFLNRGQYSVEFTPASSQSQAPVLFQLSGETSSSPLGPQLRDTTLQAVAAPSETALAQLSFFWLSFGSTEARSRIAPISAPVRFNAAPIGVFLTASNWDSITPPYSPTSSSGTMNAWLTATSSGPLANSREALIDSVLTTTEMEEGFDDTRIDRASYQTPETLFRRLEMDDVSYVGAASSPQNPPKIMAPNGADQVVEADHAATVAVDAADEVVSAGLSRHSVDPREMGDESISKDQGNAYNDWAAGVCLAAAACLIDPIRPRPFVAASGRPKS